MWLIQRVLEDSGLAESRILIGHSAYEMVIRPFIEITSKKQPSKSTFNFAGSTFTFRWLPAHKITFCNSFGILYWYRLRFWWKYFFLCSRRILPTGCFFDIADIGTINCDGTFWVYMFWSLIFWLSRDRFWMIQEMWWFGLFPYVVTRKKYGHSYLDLSGF